MNKNKIFSFFITSYFILFSCFSFAKSENSIFENDALFLNKLKIYDKEISDYIPFELIYDAYKIWCDDQVYETTNNIAALLSKKWDKKIKPNKYKEIMSIRFDILKWMLQEVDQKSKNEKSFCKNKLLIYHLLETTQNLYLKKTNKTKSEVEENNKINKIYNSENFHWSAIPNYLLTLQTNTKNLTNNDQIFVKNAENYIQKEISNLLDIKFLNHDDIEILNNKIFINFNKSCKNTKWSFHILQNKDKTIKQFKYIELNINLCDSNEYKNNYENYIKQIFIHEISHYIYEFKDDSVNVFDSICWEWWKMKAICSNGDFVSNYSKNNFAEDYAESMAYRYLNIYNWVNKEKWSAPSKYLWEKLLYFNDLKNRINY